MKTIILIILLFALSGQISKAQWVEMSNGIGSIWVSSLAVSGNNIFAGTSPGSGIFKSTDNGLSWNQTSLNNQDIRSIAVNGNIIYAGSLSGNGVYKSTDNGTSWIQTSLNNITIRSLAVNGNYVYAGAYTPNFGVYRSTDNGTTWNQTSLNNQLIRALTVNGNYVFAGSGSNPSTGVYRSTDNGSNWVLTSLHDYIGALSVNGNIIFAGLGNNHGVSLSTDNGETWYQTSLSSGSVYSFAFSGNNVFAGTFSAGVYMSTNNGLTWAQRNEGLSTNNTLVYDLCILNSYIFAGIGNAAPMGVYRRPLGELIGIHSISSEIPDKFTLLQNYPNPFNPATKIKFALPNSSFAKLVIYDALGRVVETLINEHLKAGTYEADWSAGKYSSGIYFYTLTSGTFSRTNKMLLLK